jgi:hypothetical protein
MKFKRGETFPIKFSTTPPQVDVSKVATSAEQVERIRERAKNVREAMGTRYVFHEQNRVQRIERAQKERAQKERPQNRRFKGDTEESGAQSIPPGVRLRKCV